MKKKQPRPPARTMRVVRAWLPEGQYKYFVVYSDGEVRPSTKKEAVQYTNAYKVPIETVLGEPK